MSSTSEIEIKNIDHLGIVAGLIDEIGIVDTINSKLGIDCREKISSGTVVKAILINGLGFVSKPLYLFSQFFEDKAIESLLGAGVKKDYINDDKIGRVMDDLYKYGLNNLFIEIGLLVSKKFQIETKYSHLDATSFHLHGKYKSEDNQEKKTEITKERRIIITNYKNQQSCERGFRFLKDPLFFADSFFVENPERIETMLFLMSLCLWVYNLGQRELRKSLKRAKNGIKNQVGKLTNCPTLRWIFQCFQGIHVLNLNGVNQIVNLTESRHYILNFLPSSCQKSDGVTTPSKALADGG